MSWPRYVFCHSPLTILLMSDILPAAAANPECQHDDETGARINSSTQSTGTAHIVAV
jgi:hypothetical protein